jgi:predicted kinase
MAEAQASPKRFNLAQAVAEIEERLTNTDQTTVRPVLIMISGLPGTGKSCLARKLAEREPFVILEADFVRKTLCPQPTYTAWESHWVHCTIHALIRKFLARGLRVIYDATNLIEYQREMVYHIADKAGTKLVIVVTVGSDEVVQERLRRRHEGQREAGDISDATWQIYQRMARQQQPIRRNYLVVDTGQDLDQAIRKILRVARK